MSESRLDVDRARREAKQLLDAARAGDPAARARLRPDRLPRLTDAQHSVAQSHGFRSWSALVHAHDDAGAALRRAARAGDDDAVYALLVAGAPPNARDRRSGRTPLLVAAAADQLDSLSVLVTWEPVDLQACDRRGHNALDLARPGSAVAAVLTSCGLGPRDPRPSENRYAAQADAVDVALLDHISRAPDVERMPVGDGFGLRTGLADNSRNGVVCNRLAADVDVAAIVASFADIPARWYLDDEDGADDLRLRLEQAGCEAERAAVHMVAELDDLPAVRSSIVTEVADASHLVHLDAGEARLLAAAGPPLRHFVVDEHAGLTAFEWGSSLLVEHLQVDRAHRRRGIATMLLNHALAMGRSDGCTHAVLAPTAATVSFYERLGFRLERSRPDRWYYLPYSAASVTAEPGT